MGKSITISNPRPGGSQYTTASRATDFVRRGIATLQGTILTFVDRNPIHMEAQGDIVLWNGSSKDPGAMHRPGEIRS